MKIRNAEENEAQALFALAMRSKAAWGYDRAFMKACARELFPSDLSLAGVAVEDARPVGFYSLETEDDGTLELGHLFVEPSCWGRGFGRALLAHAARRARLRGHTALVIQGDPFARGFYERCGARLIGARPSDSIPGRRLPLFRLDLES
jgi:GNAT superfamily N-acetyltransferase